MFLFISDNMWLVFGCLTLTVAGFQNVNAQYGYGYDPRYSFNANRRIYAAYPSYIASAAGTSYASNSGSRTSYSNGGSGGSFLSGSGAAYPSNYPAGAAYPNSNVAGAAYPNSNVAGAAYPNSNAAGAAYPSNNAAGAVYPSNNAAGVVYPSNAGGVVYPSDSRQGVVNPSYISNGAVYPSDSRGGVPYPSYSGNGAAYPGNTAGTSYPSSVPTGVISTQDSSGKKIHLDVYYETNCPDSMRFITSQLYPVYRDLNDIISVHLIPFGKARAFYDENSQKYEFQCHHGPRECYGNTIQGCAISLYPDTETHLNFINCMESYPRPSESGPKCARRLSLDWKSISKCADGEAGKQILYQNGELTKQLQPSLTFVPWINVNKVHSDSTQRRALRDLKSVICDAHEGRHPKC